MQKRPLTRFNNASQQKLGGYIGGTIENIILNAEKLLNIPVKFSNNNKNDSLLSTLLFKEWSYSYSNWTREDDMGCQSV